MAPVTVSAGQHVDVCSQNPASSRSFLCRDTHLLSPEVGVRLLVLEFPSPYQASLRPHGATALSPIMAARSSEGRTLSVRGSLRYLPAQWPLPCHLMVVSPNYV